jgi:beta-N-acetylhexosaminidase
MSQQIGALLIDLNGLEITAEEVELLQHPLVGGIVLFARNYESREQLIALCKSVRSSRKTPLLITVDQEGGRVQRFKNDFVLLPPMGEIGNLYDESRDAAVTFAYHYGWIMAAELLSAGIDLSFAPVLDLDKKNNKVVGDRAFHSDQRKVTDLAKSVIRGMREAGMAATGKHFPGHGHVSVDSHLELPVDNRPFEEILIDDLLPFMELIKYNIEALMPSHILFPKVDDKPVGFSQVWLQKVLRKQLHFQGVVISDALDMQAANSVGSMPERVVAALDAGCDLALALNNRQAVIQVLDELPQKYFIDVAKFDLLQGKFSKSVTNIKESKEWQEHYHLFLKHRKVYE